MGFILPWTLDTDPEEQKTMGKTQARDKTPSEV